MRYSGKAIIVYTLINHTVNLKCLVNNTSTNSHCRHNDFKELIFSSRIPFMILCFLVEKYKNVKLFRVIIYFNALLFLLLLFTQYPNSGEIHKFYYPRQWSRNN